MTFFDFLRDKLLFPLAQTSKVFISIFSAIGEMFDDLIDDAYSIAYEFFPYLSKNIRKHMKDRGIMPFPNEPSESLQSRIINAYNFYISSGTMAGIKKIISYYTSASFTITTVNNEPFAYYININDTLTTAQKDILLSVLEEYKKAHVKVYILCMDSYNEFIVGESFVGQIKI
jgi:hypothetical protein